MVDRPVQKITSPYGPRGKTFHRGVDLRTWDIKFWKPQAIIFPEFCKVLRIWEDDWGGGMAVEPLESIMFDELKFIHVKIKPEIIAGKTYERGTVIGYSMLSKLNKSHHLHFEVHVEKSTVNPTTYFEYRGIQYA